MKRRPEDAAKGGLKKPSETGKSINIRLPLDVAEKVSLQAEEEGLHPATVVRLAVEWYYEKK